MAEGMNILGSRALYKVPLTYKSPGDCNEILDFLLLNLEQGSSKEKLKVLKVLKYLVTNGHASFQQDLFKRDRLIKEATAYNGPVDPIHGNSLNNAVKNEAEETLRLLFEGFADSDSKITQKFQEKSKGVGGFPLTGMGSLAQKEKYEGFGSTPIAPNKTMVDKMVVGITDMVEKIINAQDEKTAALTSAMTVDSGSYHAVPLPASHSNATETVEVRIPKTARTPNNSCRSHVPGRAGGGWEDDDDIYNQVKQFQRSVTSHDSESEHRGEPDVPSSEEHLAEEQFVRDILESEKPLTSWKELDNICSRCGTLNCDRILDLFHEQLSNDRDSVRQKILMIIEALLHADIVPFELLFSMFGTTLHTMESDRSASVRAKSKKLTLIFENLLPALGKDQAHLGDQ